MYGHTPFLSLRGQGFLAGLKFLCVARIYLPALGFCVRTVICILRGCFFPLINRTEEEHNLKKMPSGLTSLGQ